ncbi:MAG: anti-sigma factor antagonist [Cyanobacteriota bacterium]|nr:anti-sigma factor antagonist [Cyanobacteriota bacterium]
MALTSTLEIFNDIAAITLAGDLDASTAPQFQKAVEEAAQHKPQKLVLKLEALDYMASAGLRVLIFSKQKMGAAVTIYVVNPQDSVWETMKKTGFHQSVVRLDQFDPEAMAN